MTSEQTSAVTGGAATSAGAGFAVTREIRIAAPPEIVWEYFVDPERIKQWEAVDAEADARPGGALRIDMHGDRDIAMGEFVTLEPHSRLVFTWGWEGNEMLPPGASTVEVTLTSEGDETVVRLEHRDLPSQELADGHGEGWTHYLGRLAIASAGGDPGPDPMIEATG